MSQWAEFRFQYTKVIEFLDKIFGVVAPSILDSNFSSDTAYEQANEGDMVVVLPKPNQLFVDIDTDLQYTLFHQRIQHLWGFYSGTVEEHPSRSGYPHRHLTVTLTSGDIDDKERLLLQLFLGSDPTREFLGLQRVKVNDRAPTLFLERKDDPLAMPKGFDHIDVKEDRL